MKGKEDPTDLLITAITLNFLRICDQYKITLEDICEDIDKISESCTMCMGQIDPMDPDPEKKESSPKPYQELS